MLLISHRGNLNGPDKSIENKPEHLEYVMKNYSVEVDLRVHKDKLYLGHDECQYPIDRKWLFEYSPLLWIHCKDHEALRFCSTLTFYINYFWHDTDDYTMTNMRFIWAYPGKKKVNNLTILVKPEDHWSQSEIIEMQPFGICSDFVEQYKYINRI